MVLGENGDCAPMNSTQPPPPSAAGPSSSPAPPLAGREPQLAQLHDAVSEVTRGSGRLVVLAGEAGIGKTRMVEELTRVASDAGLWVATGHCWETVDAPAFWPWTQALRRLSAQLSSEQLVVAIEGLTPELAGILPELGARSSQPAQPDSTSRFRLFEAVAAVLHRIARTHACVLVLEDLHAADESSLLLLKLLATDYAHSPIVIAVTYDDIEVRTKPLQSRLLTEIARYGRRIPLGRLGVEEIRKLYAELAGSEPSDAVATALFEASEGVPLFVEEAVRMLHTQGDLRRPDHSVGFRVPEGSRAIIRYRIDLLPREVAELLSLASVIGKRFDVALLEKISGIKTDALLDLLGNGVAAGLLHETSALGKYEYSHILIRETLYEDLPAGERMRLHLNVAEILEKNAVAQDDAAEVARLAHHWFKAAQAGDANKTLRYTLAAAEAAMSRQAYEEAARLYHRAVKVAETIRLDKREIAEIQQGVERAQKRAHEPQPASATRARLEREGDLWAIDFAGKLLRLKDAKGLRYIALLLAMPGREVHVMDLVRTLEGPPIETSRPVHAPTDLTAAGWGDAGEVLDPLAKQQYRQRLKDLHDELQEAEAFNDPERAAHYRQEIDALTEQLAGGVGLGGRDRKAASQVERARVSVTKAIKESLKRIADQHPVLGGHLRSAVRTGTFCSYQPDPSAPVDWDLPGRA